MLPSRMFKRMIIPIVCASWVALCGAAQAEDRPENGLELFEEATRLILKGLIEELGPAWDEMQHLLENLSAYHPPEILPNGDIIIRRKTPLPDGDELEL